MNYDHIITVKELRQKFKYHPEGYLIRKVKTHTRSFIGEIVFGYSSGIKNNLEYKRLKIKKKYIPFHVAIFAVVKNKFPKNILDHKDKNGLNNKIANLREATYSQNTFNTKINSRNKTGHRGIFWVKTRAKWKVILCTNKKYHFLGEFKNKLDAIKVQKRFIKKHHKDFSNNAK